MVNQIAECGRFSWDDVTSRVIAKADRDSVQGPGAGAIRTGETLRVMLRLFAGLPEAPPSEGPVLFDAPPPWAEVLNIAWVGYSSAVISHDQRAGRRAVVAESKRAADVCKMAKKSFSTAVDQCRQGLGAEMWTGELERQVRDDPERFESHEIPLIAKVRCHWFVVVVVVAVAPSPQGCSAMSHCENCCRSCAHTVAVSIAGRPQRSTGSHSDCKSQAA